MASILDLSTELLCLIIGQLPLTSHFDFACTCKRFAAAAQHVLHRHQEAHNKFRVASDLDPTIVLRLLQSAFGGDPIPAWHVRSFEVWRDRRAWDEWTTYDLSTPFTYETDGGVSDLQVLGLQPVLATVTTYLDCFEEHAYKQIDREKAISQVETGHDGLLKALLFAKCPRLRDLKFVTRSQKSGTTLSWLKTLISISKGLQPEHEPSQCSEHEDYLHHEEATEEREDRLESRRNYEKLLQGDCHSETESEFEREWEVAYARWAEEQALQDMERMKICETDENCEQKIESGRTQDNESNCTRDDDSSSSFPVDLDQWSAGFASVRYVAVGVVSGTWMDDERYPNAGSLIARLLRLPNLDTLYFNGLRFEPDDGHVSESDDADSDTDSDISEWTIYDFPAHSSSVKHYFFEGLGYELDGDFRELLCEAPRKLLTAAFRNSGPDSDVQRASRIVRDLANAQGSSLKSLMWYAFDSGSIHSDECSVAEVEEFKDLQALKQVSFNVHDLATGAERETWDHDIEGYDSIEDYYVQYAAEAFPKSMESLVLWEDAGTGVIGDAEGEAVLLECAIVKLIENGRYRNLEAIFLEEVERATDGGRGTVSFEKAIAAGKTAGVEVHTLTNKPMQHSISFPEPVDQYDLKTGKFPAGRPSDWVFDPYTGCRGPPGDNGMR